jgi:hypothetical protein
MLWLALIIWLLLGLMGRMLLIHQLHQTLVWEPRSDTPLVIPKRIMIIQGPFGLFSAVRAMLSLPEGKRHWGLRLSIW